MKLLNYIPDVLKDYIEINAICNSEDIEILELNKKIDILKNDTYIKEASVIGVERFEKIYNLIPLPQDSLLTRKKRIINKITNRLPYSYRWLVNKLNILVGEGNYILNLNTDEYDLLINISGITSEQLESFRNDMKFMLPANINVDVRIQDSTKNNMYFGGFIHIGGSFYIKGIGGE